MTHNAENKLHLIVIRKSSYLVHCIIDLIITTKSEKKTQEVSTVLSTISDHYPVYKNIKKPMTTIKKSKLKEETIHRKH